MHGISKRQSFKIAARSHVILWWLFDDPKLSGSAHDVIQASGNTILVSSASGWEIATKYRLGKYHMPTKYPARIPPKASPKSYFYPAYLGHTPPD